MRWIKALVALLGYQVIGKTLGKGSKKLHIILLKYCPCLTKIRIIANLASIK
jgi:hypothetical protein